MKEPVSEMGITYSALPSNVLRNFASGLDSIGLPNPVGYVNPHEPEFYDADFRARYAAFLLKERGL